MERDTIQGIRLSRLTDEVLSDVLDIYAQQVAGGDLPNWVYNVVNCEYIREFFGPNARIIRSALEWRLGSVLSGHSKLYLHRVMSEEDQIIRFEFYPNLGRDASEDDEMEGERLGQTFTKAINEYLVEQGLSIPLST